VKAQQVHRRTQAALPLPPLPWRVWLRVKKRCRGAHTARSFDAGGGSAQAGDRSDRCRGVAPGRDDVMCSRSRMRLCPAHQVRL
jgi:hypothetical protein